MMATIRLHNALFTFATLLVFHQLEAVVAATAEAAIVVRASVAASALVVRTFVYICNTIVG